MSNELSEFVIRDARFVYPFIANFALFKGRGMDFFIDGFKLDFYPEGQVYWWQEFVIITLETIGRTKKAKGMPDCKLNNLAPHGNDVLGDEDTLQAFRAVAEEMRPEVHAGVYDSLTSGGSLTIVPHFLEALTVVKNHRRHIGEEIRKGKMESARL